MIVKNKIIQLLDNEQGLKRFLLVFYIVGAAGFAIPYTRAFFSMLTPLALMLNYFILVYHHKSGWRHGWVFALIYFLGFFVEVAGVQTGMIFGNYEYGSGLGIKLAETPLLIGFNWLMLVYTTFVLTDSRKLPVLAKVFIASGLMVIYDIITEQTAPLLNMWSWDDGNIPLQNYLAWFVIAFVMHGLIRISGVRIQNNFAKYILLLQTFFFLILYLISLL